MRDITHMQHIRRWAEFVKENPHAWKTIHTEFINAQFQKSEEFYKRILTTPKGKKKIAKLFGIKNPEFFTSDGTD